MSTLAAFFGQSTDKRSPDDDRLMDLYRNRNALKKEFADLRNEKYKLTDQLKRHKGDLARMQQKFEQLEQLLLDPEWARNVMVLYQLRALGLRCTRKVSGFAEQIKQQREKKKHSESVTKWQSRVAQDVAAIDEQIAQARQQTFALEESIRQQEQNLAAMNGFLRFLRNRPVRSRIDKLTSDVRDIESRIQTHFSEIEAVKSGQPPDAEGLVLREKRSINFMIIAYAQQLYIDFGDDELVSLVKEATDKSAGAVRYGDEQACEDILQRLRRCGRRLEKGADVAAQLTRRAQLIREGAVFKDDGDAVPIAGTVATLFRIGENDTIRTSDADLLGQNVWGLAAAMSR